MNETVKMDLKHTNAWMRVLYMLLFMVIFSFARLLIWAVVLFQMATNLLTGSANPHVTRAGAWLAAYVYRILLFLTCNSEAMPFPFSDWRSSGEAIGNAGQLER